MFYVLLKNFVTKTLGPTTYITGPGRYRKVEEVKMKNSDKFAGRNSATLKSCDQETERFDEYQVDEYQSLSG